MSAKHAVNLRVSRLLPLDPRLHAPPGSAPAVIDYVITDVHLQICGPP